MGGAVDLLRFGVFGDMRPPLDNATTQYPTSIVTAVMSGFVSQGAQFAVATGDYMFANSTATVGAQVSLLLGIEAHFPHHIFHGMGNHECNALASLTGAYGFVMVEQRADGDLVVTAFEIGTPPMVADSFVLTPAATLTH